MSYSNEKLKSIFYSSLKCNCNSQDCISNHRICYICKEKIQWNEYCSKNSSCSWNVDHFIPTSKYGNNKNKNLKAVHPWCNEQKGNKFFK